MRKGGTLAPGLSPYWCDHLNDWKKLRAQREGEGKTVIEIDPIEWCEAHGVKATDKEAADIFLRRNHGLQQVNESVASGKVQVGDEGKSKEEVKTKSGGNKP